MDINKYYRLESICGWIYENKVFPCDSNGLPDLGKGVNLIDLKDDWFKILNNEEKEHIAKLINEFKKDA
jgi:hypothetical protein